VERVEQLIYIREIRKKDRYQFTIVWTDGKIFDYRLSDLQRRCPCARCRDIDPASIADDVEALRIASVGRYALQIYFTQGCSKGIYSYQLLRTISGGCV
jgi:DUF971 family protein